MSQLPLTEEQRDLVSRNYGVAVNVARQRAGSMERDDAIQEALIGLMRASQKYRPDRFVSFADYGEIRARGSVADAKRKMGFIAVCRPEKLKKKVEIPRVVNGLDDYSELLSSENSVVDQVIRKEWHERFWGVVSAMKPRTQEIIKSRLSGLSLREIACHHKVDTSRVSQLIASAVCLLDSAMREREIA